MLSGKAVCFAYAKKEGRSWWFCDGAGGALGMLRRWRANGLMSWEVRLDENERISFVAVDRLHDAVRSTILPFGHIWSSG